MALSFKNTDLVLLRDEDELNQDSLNKKFQLLVSYDAAISRSFINSIGVWHCSWYYDDNIKGYSKGDLVWLNTEDPEKFISTHYAIIKQYTDLNAEVLVKLPNFDPQSDYVVNRYLNALSGYVDSKSSNVKPLDPIFDLGDYSKPIQLAVSLLDNNKKLVSDETGWKMLFVDDASSEDKIKEVIEDVDKNKIDKHLIDYHLSGKENIVAAQLSDYLDFSHNGIEYDDAPNSWYANYNSDNFKFGMDYVVSYIRKPLMLSGGISQYQAVRYWKSGWMEHFGTIATSNLRTSSISADMLWIPFDWKIVGDDSGAKAYEHGELANSLDYLLSVSETSQSLIPPLDNLINVLFERKNAEANGSSTAKPFKDSSYNISISPIFQTQSGIQENYITVSYGQSENQTWNSNYIADEIVESMKLKNGFAIKNNGRTLAPYISYYATGIGAV